MTYTVDPATANPAYADPSGDFIDITVTLDSIGQTLRYTCSSNDSAVLSQELFSNCKAGTYGAIAAYTGPNASAKAVAALRQERDSRLQACDWTKLPDAPLTTAKQAEWTAYRQALRDLPANTPDPTNPTWPTPPAA